MSTISPDPHRPLKDAFGRFATGITLAGCVNAHGAPTVITVNSFTSVSLEPPLVLWCLENKAASYKAFYDASHYGISILRADQEDMSNRFAGYQPAPLQADEMAPTKSGAPVLKACLASFDCKIVDRHRAGDHLILIGEVEGFTSTQGEPLIYFASQYGCGPHS